MVLEYQKYITKFLMVLEGAKGDAKMKLFNAYNVVWDQFKSTRKTHELGPCSSKKETLGQYR